MMKKDTKHILLIYPQLDISYWDMQYMLEVVGKKALMPPLGLITIAAMIPEKYALRLIDLNCEPLSEEDIAWADIACLSAMIPQKTSLFACAERLRRAGKTVVFGGPYPTTSPDECMPYCDVLVLNEGEITWKAFLRDLEQGQFKPLYRTDVKPEMHDSPLPRFDLINPDHYAYMSIQLSRGCPYLCEFCDIIVMLGRKPRLKQVSQLLAELDAIYAGGHRGGVFVVDDNFIGNKKAVRELLIALNQWNASHDYPFFFGTEASINLAEEEELMQLMVKANFTWVFIGIETPSLEGLKETHKTQNTKHPMSEQIKAIQTAGLMVYGGFIIGFDSDDISIFDAQIAFITQAAIPGAMIGPLVALPQTPLYNRLLRENRIITDSNKQARTVASGYTNIKTRIPEQVLLEGYKKILITLYQPRAFFDRSITAFSRLPNPIVRKKGFREKVAKLKNSIFLFSHQTSRGRHTKKTPAESIRAIGKLWKQFPPAFKRESLRFAWAVLVKHPKQLHRVVPFILLGYHYYRFTFDHAVPDIERFIEEKYHFDAGEEV